MGRLFITGDCHGEHDISKLNRYNFPLQKKLTRDDVVIVCGDWGGVWYGNQKDNYMCNWWEDKNFTTFVVLGNHENYNAIEQIPITEMFGGRVRQVRPHVFIAITGEIYTINGHTFFCVNGAPSHDRMYRRENISWWPQEIPSMDDLERGLDNLEKINYKVDYIISHEASDFILDRLPYNPTHNRISNYLEMVVREVKPKAHFFGHHHMDKFFTEKDICLYQNIIEIGAE